MNYEDLIDRALDGRTVNRAAKDLGISQSSLDRYTKAKALPDYRSAVILAQAASIPLGDALLILAEEEQKRREVKETFTAVFRLLTNALNRLYTRVSIA
jgi:transcriptional regulator with XRE-family HTH domain